ncbi:metallophosphoesterase family protein [Slackia heliotrinireducens]|uniref:metallophosphoesterase family protein n=1 Tax=Slackia heliotrinireducens TaxID=84110 RepID=UPI003314BC4D
MTTDGDEVLVGILSDTHGRLPQQAYAELADCDHIIHAGDIGDSGILEELRALAPVTAVLGNNDWYGQYGSSVEQYATVTLDKVRFMVAHIPRDLQMFIRGAASRANTNALIEGLPAKERAKMKPLKLPDGTTTVAVHGHTHIPEIKRGAEAAPADYIVCPGSCTYPRGSSYRCVMKILVNDGSVENIGLIELTRS